MHWLVSSENHFSREARGDIKFKSNEAVLLFGSAFIHSEAAAVSVLHNLPINLDELTLCLYRKTEKKGFGSLVSYFILGVFWVYEERVTSHSRSQGES